VPVGHSYRVEPYRVEQWQPAEAARRAGAVVDVYRAAFAPYGEDDEAVTGFAERSLPRHLARDGFRCVAAVDGDTLLGFGYGYTGARGQYWTDRVSRLAPPDVVDRWIGGHFEFVELAVQPDRQGQGIGGALHDALMADLPHRHALLSTWQQDTPARQLYLHRGWRALAELPDATLMGKTLRTAAAPD
jgi:GNAT superfamily N-acetyltransferase